MLFFIRLMRRLVYAVVGLVEKLPPMRKVTLHTHVVKLQKVPEALSGLRLVYAADLHERSFGENQEHLLSVIESACPDVVLLGGDYIRNEFGGEGRRHVENLLESLSRTYPVYAVLGNHETASPELAEILEVFRRFKIHLLQDEIAYFSHNGAKLEIMGLRTPLDRCAHMKERPYHMEKDTETAIHALYELAEPSETASEGSGKGESPGKSQEGFRIVLCHRPEFFPYLARFSAKEQLVLSGHTHGGLFRFPNGRPLAAPDQGIFPYLACGTHRRGNSSLIISDGLGGPRLNVRPGIELIILTREG